MSSGIYHFSRHFEIRTLTLEINYLQSMDSCSNIDSLDLRKNYICELQNCRYSKTIFQSTLYYKICFFNRLRFFRFVLPSSRAQRMKLRLKIFRMLTSCWWIRTKQLRWALTMKINRKTSCGHIDTSIWLPVKKRQFLLPVDQKKVANESTCGNENKNRKYIKTIYAWIQISKKARKIQLKCM